MSQQYNFKKIESKWQKYWEKNKFYQAEDFSKKPKYYCLIEFPYPSGDGLHVGHTRSYTAMDIISRKRRMEGYNVLNPIGWDAFGLPTENYAIKTGVHPKIVTQKNTDIFRRQLKSLGFSFDWSREINTTDPEYYKWTQWIFLQFYKKGLAYKKKMPINWCLSCKIGLANEEVVDGRCERCGGETEKREKEQWMLAITKYADRLLKDLDKVDYLERIKTQQVNWIGKSHGVNFKQKVKDLNIEFEVYDSIPQTFLAQTFTIIAPEHPLVKKLVAGTKYEKPVLEFVKKIKQKKISKKFDIKNDLEGIFTGRFVENPFDTGDFPIWVASFVLVDYGTGIVNCSAHDKRDFAFAKKYNIPLKVVLLPKDTKHAEKVRNLEVFYRELDGILQEPIKFKGMTWLETRGLIIKYIREKGFGRETIQYKLRDWIFSRQHYWGEPIPIIHCDKCGEVPVQEKDLPVKLPDVKKYQPTDTGESPLANVKNWVNVKCPKCKSPAKRETDTMPNWAGSSWYYLAYLMRGNPKSEILNPKQIQNSKSKIQKYKWDKKKLKYWAPVDWYNGGMEHTTLHLLYSRFWNKFLYDIGVASTSEPYKKRTSHGMILGENGEKMSKSKGNVVNPDDVVANFGADAFRLYQMFMGPFDQAIPWDSRGIEGTKRFIGKIWDIAHTKNISAQINNKELEKLLHKTLKKVGEDIEGMNFNTAVSALMIFVNKCYEVDDLPKKVWEKFLIILSLFAPHITEELWQQLFGNLKSEKFQSIHLMSWPEYDPKLIIDDTFELVIQINGKIRDIVSVEKDISQKQAEEIVLSREKVQNWIKGGKIKKTIFVPNRLINILI